VRAYVALGSNLGDRAGYLARARAALAALPGTRVRGASRLYQTDPVGPPGQGPYLNQVLRLETGLPPGALLRAMLAIERENGRVRTVRFGPRTLDLDLLDWGGLAIRAPGLVLPHPRLHLRAFVLVPLAELDPAWRHPRLGRTAAGLLRRVDRRGVRPYP